MKIYPIINNRKLFMQECACNLLEDMCKINRLWYKLQPNRYGTRAQF